MSSVLVLGSYNHDHVFVVPQLPEPGATRTGRYSEGPGGKGFNQAVAAARSGAATRFVVALGADAAAQTARTLATGFGIDLIDELHAETATGSAGIFVDSSGRNVIVVAPGANALLSDGFVAQQTELLAAAAIVLAQLEVRVPAVIEALRLARAAGTRTVLNPAPADAEFSPELIELADLITPNETEFAALVSRLLGERFEADAIAEMPGAQLHALCRRLHRGSVVITLGKIGVFVSHADPAFWNDATAHYRVAAIRANAIDTTGAGDAFNGALVAEWARDPSQSLATAIRYATAYAGLSTEQRGAALAMPSRAAVEARMARD